ncbi:hypothetical protein IHQ56_18125 [Methylobacillus flagellatus]|uniref:hypothetical protein n=1 Tax=Methylobacillus flagellatus TaxID=405 RepID=UPI002853F0E9|nr:hypothetical protein [Methylobacillus flagellatus]MDR5172998.1 hypothetical protein [Methylobacillus flagellatus]
MPVHSTLDAPTGTFQAGRDHHHLHGQMDDVERFCRQVLAEIARRRRAAEPAWPKDFLKQIADF